MNSGSAPQPVPLSGGRRLAQIAAFVLLAGVLCYTMTYALTVGALDFSVYRLGAMTVFNNEGFDKELYVIDLLRLNEDFSLPFTYPPFAALIFVPLAFIPPWLGIVVMMLLAWAVAFWLATLIMRYTQERGRQLPLQHYLGERATLALLLTLILCSGPWLRGMGLVQINPLIMLLVLWDFLRPARKLPRGFFIGIAGGIKLTPLAFGLILLVRKDIKGLLTLAASFFTSVAIGFLLLPRESVEFWTSAVSDPSRVGNINYLDNISIQGWLMHLGLGPGLGLKIVHYGLILALMLGVARLLVILEDRHMLLSQISLNAFLMLSMSPISWSHHNIWLPLLVAALWLDAFPTFFAQGPAGIKTLASICAWVGSLGLWISPMWIGSWLHGSSDQLDYIARLPLLISAIPIIALFMTVCLWIIVGIRSTRR
ncbi:MAG: glycosyltransferase family 87 protein [Rothia sp. (in: high G+C Gram-positive bacteria)]|nr:glycosyltransferase family 87 protein [Rothia sp. (in: high G+C Gram-positive bacteria)]